MYDVLPILDEGPASYLFMSVGLDGARVSRANLLSQRQHFGLAQDEAEGILNLVGGWVDELKEYYADFLQGKVLELARNATAHRGFWAERQWRAAYGKIRLIFGMCPADLVSGKRLELAFRSWNVCHGKAGPVDRGANGASCAD